MSRRLLPALALLAVLGALLLRWRSPERHDEPRALQVHRPQGARATAAPALPSPPLRSAPGARAGEPRYALAEQLPAEGVVGRAVQAAMSKPGDSDRRLLDGLSWLGLHPSQGASLAASLDPWLAVGLVDLERQMARRCVQRGEARAGCFERALAAEEALGLALADHPAGSALDLFAAHDREMAAAPPGRDQD